MGAAVHLEREQAVDAALHHKRQDRANVAVAIGVPDVDAVVPEPVADAPVAGRDHVAEERHGNYRPVLEADVLPPAGVVEVHLAQHLVQHVLCQPAGRLDHVLDHLRIVVTCVAEALEGERVAYCPDHRAAENAQRVVAAARVALLERLDVDLSGRVVDAKPLSLDSPPVLRRLDGTLEIVRDGGMTVLGHLSQQAVVVADDLVRVGLGDHLLGESRVHPHPAAPVGDAVEVEKLIRLGVVADAVLREHRPGREVLLPVSELHVKAAVNALVVHLVVEPLAVGHGRLPLRPDRRYGHPCVSFSSMTAPRDCYPWASFVTSSSSSSFASASYFLLPTSYCLFPSPTSRRVGAPSGGQTDGGASCHRVAGSPLCNARLASPCGSGRTR